MRRGSDFGASVRRGRRAGNKSVVVHVLQDSAESPPVVGFVVSKAVGGAVVRNRTKRRLRALMRPLLVDLPAGARVVVRANPAAAGTSTTALARDLASALRRVGAGPAGGGR